MLMKSSYTPAEIRQILANEETRNKKFYYARLERYCRKISRVMAKKRWKGVTVFFNGITSRSRRAPTTPCSIYLNENASCIEDLALRLEQRGFTVEVTSEKSRNVLKVNV